MIQRSVFEELLLKKAFSKELVKMETISKRPARETIRNHSVQSSERPMCSAKEENKTFTHSMFLYQPNDQKDYIITPPLPFTYRKNNKKKDTDVFISYSSKDQDYAISIRQGLKRLGLEVYIDFFDYTMDPKNVNKDTAQKLKEEIQKSKGILYIHSQKSELSQWCPWELGLGEGIKSRICVLEVIDDSTYQQEYLKMYPYIDFKDNVNDDKINFLVVDRENEKKSIDLVGYLNGRNPI